MDFCEHGDETSGSVKGGKPVRELRILRHVVNNVHKMCVFFDFKNVFKTRYPRQIMSIITMNDIR